MATPTDSYMLLTAGEDDTHSDIYSSSRIKIGDTIKISGTASNNGVFFVSDVTVDSTNVYFILKGNQIVSEDSNTNRDLQIEVVRSTGDKLIALGDAGTAGGNIDVWSQNATTNSATKNNGWTQPAIQPTIDGVNSKYIYHFVDEALRVCNVNELNTAHIKWYGYIQRHQFAYAGADASDDSVGYSPVFAEWQEHPNILRPPRVTGGFTYCYVNSPNVNQTTNTTLSSSEHDGTQNTNYFSEQRGVAIKKLNSANSNSPLEINDTGTIAANLTDTDFNFQDAANAPILDQSILGEVITIDEDLGTAPREYLFCTKTSGAAGGGITYSRAYGGALSGTAPDSYADEETPIIERGIGFNVGITDGTADGNWESATYEFYQSFVYDDSQESLPIKMGDGDDGTNLAVGTHTAAGGTALRVSIYADLAYSGRVSGGRIYIRKQNTDDDLTLLADIDIVKGVRMSLDGDHNNWEYENGNGYFVLGDATGNSITPNIDTYVTINGFSPDVRFVSIGSRGESYKASVVAGRRTFIANVRTFGATGELERFGDRIMYSEINKFDTFLPHNFIDVSKGDFGEYTALEVFADRILAFKHNLVHIINIANPSPSNWYLEDTVKYHGVSYSYSITRTEFGVAWVNESGCYLYDGSKVVNLVEKKLGVTQSTISNGESDYTDTDAYTSGGEAETGLVSPPLPWFEIAKGSANYKDPLVGYDSISNSLIIIRSPSNNSANSNLAYVYDFDSNGWVFSTELITNSRHCTNLVTDWNSNLIFGIYDGSSDVNFYKYLTVPSASLYQEFITKDIDFGAPGIIKKIYSVSITYKAATSGQANPLEYAIDGTQSFSSFATKTLATASAWDVATFKASSPVSCQSIQLRLNLPSNGTFEVNDITIEYRIIRNKMVS